MCSSSICSTPQRWYSFSSSGSAGSPYIGVTRERPQSLKSPELKSHLLPPHCHHHHHHHHLIHHHHHHHHLIHDHYLIYDHDELTNHQRSEQQWGSSSRPRGLLHTRKGLEASPELLPNDDNFNDDEENSYDDGNIDNTRGHIKRTWGFSKIAAWWRQF